MQSTPSRAESHGRQDYRPVRPQQSDKAPQNRSAFLDVLERIEQTVEAETEALRQFKVVDLHEFNARKSQGLLEMSRAVRGLGSAGLDGPASSRLKLLRAKLEVNQALLATHLKAAKEITSIVAATIRDSESDGTYSNAMRYGNADPW